MTHRHSFIKKSPLLNIRSDMLAQSELFLRVKLIEKLNIKKAESLPFSSILSDNVPQLTYETSTCHNNRQHISSITINAIIITLFFLSIFIGNLLIHA